MPKKNLTSHFASQKNLKFSRQLQDIETSLYTCKNEFFMYLHLAEMFVLVDDELMEFLPKNDITEKDNHMYVSELSQLNVSIVMLLNSIQKEAFAIQRAMKNSFILKEDVIFDLTLD